MLSRLTVSAIATALLCVCSTALAADIKPLPQAHAHNDYLHDRPLLDALENGFCSVEADIFLVDGELLVAHTRRELSPDRTLRGLYLEPLHQRLKKNNGRVHADEPGFTLLIDIKNNGEETWRQLNQMLSEYEDMFSSVKDGEFHSGAVHVVVSGDRAWDVIAATSPRFAGVDGRISDFGGGHPVHLMPLVSDNWRRHFRWRGKGEFPEAERTKLKQLVQQAHDENRRIRFWASPDTPEMWQELNAAGTDLINTDDLPGLSQFLRSNTQ